VIIEHARRRTHRYRYDLATGVGRLGGSPLRKRISSPGLTTKPRMSSAHANCQSSNRPSLTRMRPIRRTRSSVSSRIGETVPRSYSRSRVDAVMQDLAQMLCGRVVVIHLGPAAQTSPGSCSSACQAARLPGSNRVLNPPSMTMHCTSSPRRAGAICAWLSCLARRTDSEPRARAGLIIASLVTVGGRWTSG
jgi:hypothetical protein